MIKFIALFLMSCSLHTHAFNIKPCDTTPGLADSYVLAMSLQPGFCKTYGYEAGKPECMNLSSKSYQATHLSMHGLWPNQEACRHRYGFCGNTKARSNHCAYSPLNLNPDTSEQLKKMMPSYQYGSCLERHEWNKHGSCQILSDNNYFTLAMRLTAEVDQSSFGKFLTSHNGEKVSLASLKESITGAFGIRNQGKVYLGCNHGILVDVFITLPPLIPFETPLISLMDEAPDYNNNNSCPSKVTLSAFNQD